MDLVIFAQTAFFAESGERPLDPPAPRHHFEQPAISVVHKGQAPVEHLSDPIEQGASVGRNGKDDLDPVDDRRADGAPVRS